MGIGGGAVGLVIQANYAPMVMVMVLSGAWTLGA